MKKNRPSSPVAAGVFCCSRRTFLKRAALAGAAAVCPGALTGCNEAAAALKRKIAQMLLVGFRGTAVSSDNPVMRDIRDYGLGGVVLYDSNISSPAQLKALSASLQALATIPLFIAVDQEGGSVARLKESDGFPSTVSAQYLGDTNDLELTRTHAESMASTLAINGITVNFAPVVDLNVNPDNPVIGRLERSFSADPSVVTAHAREFIEAHDRNAVMTCLKHFPGHGSSAADSHEGFVDVTATWSPDELEPYRGLISEGRCRMVMTAHIFNRDLDPDYPATLSRQIITGMLREQLGYGGVVVTDDIQMEAISAGYSYAAAVEKAILAGVDIIMVANNYAFDPDVVPQTIDLLLQLVRKGTITEKRIDASYNRICALKEALPARAELPVD
jgi:beta-N-acetylhexosaminidase